MKTINCEIKIYGIVQGVGFRPFVHKTAERLGLSGYVKNTSYGANLMLEGEERAVDKLLRELRENPPCLAHIEKIDVAKSDETVGFSRFEIEKSERDEENRTLISPDVATCGDCLRELFDKADRRYKYPFINCTNCGPRFTIIKDIPYDRKSTTMQRFQMCEPCAGEYADMADRRYHAQPDCCADCGPRLSFYDGDGKELSGEPVELTKEYLRAGKIVAVKGLGGFHLACRCDDEAVALRLRERKRRDEKPFAVMCRNAETAREYAQISEDEERLLNSPARPIVLLSKREGKDLSHLSENGDIGIMLPYTPVHHLLLTDDIKSLVMTSANISDLPIIYKNKEALGALSGVADAFLMHDREIETRCDDSLMRIFRGREYFIRRSRGYVPHPITLEREIFPILACGAEQKASFALSRGSHVFLSQHIGDLKNLETLDCYEEQIAHFEKLFDVRPRKIVCDMHPDYMSSEYARERAEKTGVSPEAVQHHHAHMASCMADNGYEGDCIGIIWDGAGAGNDGTVWGAEMLVGNLRGFERRGTIRAIALPGGDRCTKEISRVAAALMLDAGIETPESTINAQLRAGVNCPKATSMGRLFDGVSAILGIKNHVSYEGQGAVLLEAAADERVERAYAYTIGKKGGMYVLDWREMIREIVREKEAGVPVGEIAAAFMNTLLSFATDMAGKISRDTGVMTVALSGGTFQNMYLLNRLYDSLTEKGFNILVHRRVSPNDEGIALGQLMIAKEKM